MALSDEQYILLTTYRRDGTPVATPTWVVGLPDGTLGFWTSSGSGKAKRLAHTGRVTVQACDARGRTRSGTMPVDAHARVVRGPEHAAVTRLVREKYGAMTAVTKLLNTVLGTVRGKRLPYGDVAVIVSLAG